MATQDDSRQPNPFLVAWLRSFGASPARRRCLVVGCGLGDDAEALASAGFEVTAFDAAPAAIEACRQRFPRSGVDYVVADALTPPASWTGAFDIVFEANILASLPPDVRRKAQASIAAFPAIGGRLFVVCLAREDGDAAGGLPPWPLTRDELDEFARLGLRASSVERILDGETPPVMRFRAFFEKP